MMLEAKNTAKKSKHTEGPAFAQQGSTLVLMIAAISVIGLLSVLMFDSFKARLVTLKIVSESSDIADLRTFVRFSVDCQFTKAANDLACQAATPSSSLQIDLFDYDNNVLVSRNNSTFGPNVVRAKCIGPSNYVIERKGKRSSSWTNLLNGKTIQCL